MLAPSAVLTRFVRELVEMPDSVGVPLQEVKEWPVAGRQVAPLFILLGGAALLFGQFDKVGMKASDYIVMEVVHQWLGVGQPANQTAINGDSQFPEAVGEKRLELLLGSRPIPVWHRLRNGHSVQAPLEIAGNRVHRLGVMLSNLR